MAEFENRHLVENAMRPELVRAVDRLMRATFINSKLPYVLQQEVFTVTSQAAGCTHCQAHGAFTLSQLGADTARIRDLWSFETSESFSEGERAALRFALAAGTTPNGVTPDHHGDAGSALGRSKPRCRVAVEQAEGETRHQSSEDSDRPSTSRVKGVAGQTGGDMIR